MKSDIIKGRSLETKKKKALKKFENINIVNVDYNSNSYTFECDCGINHIFFITPALLMTRLRLKTKLCTICNPINSYYTSGYEVQLQEFIKSNYDGEIVLNSRNIIKPYEIDIYLPDLKLAFELNGIYWHNELYRPNNYHLNKTNLAKELGVNLTHIFEDDWVCKQDIIKSIILNKLNKISNIINFENCEIRMVDDKQSRTFLEKNHIDGFISSKIQIGLFYKDEIVFIMIFKDKSNNNYEILRFCDKIDTKIIRGFDKLLNYFIKNYKLNEIVGYSDVGLFDEMNYENFGFKLIEQIEPNYYYIIDGKRYNKNKFSKNKLVKEGYDKNKTEHEIMIDREIYRIYDCGKLKYIYK